MWRMVVRFVLPLLAARLRGGRLALRLRTVRQVAGLAARTVAAAIGGAFGLAAGVAAATLAGPGPRWLALVFAAAALIAIVLTLRDVAGVRRDVHLWHHRRDLLTALGDDDTGEPPGRTASHR